MKGKTIALIGIGVFNAGLMVLERAANKHAKARADVDAVDCRADEAKEAFKQAQERCDIFKKCVEKEEKDLANKLKDWRVANDFERRKNDLVNSRGWRSAEECGGDRKGGYDVERVLHAVGWNLEDGVRGGDHVGIKTEALVAEEDGAWE